MKKVSIREDVPVTDHLSIRVIESQTDVFDIIESHKKLAKLERHFSDDQIKKLPYPEFFETLKFFKENLIY